MPLKKVLSSSKKKSNKQKLDIIIRGLKLVEDSIELNVRPSIILAVVKTIRTDLEKIVKDLPKQT